MSVYCGIDPDTHTSPVALLAGDGTVIHIGFAESSKDLKEMDAVSGMIDSIVEQISTDEYLHATKMSAIAIESQEISYTARVGVNPASVLRLAYVTGAWASGLRFLNECPIYLPKPFVWKGNVPKSIHQTRVLRRLSVPYKVCGRGDSAYCAPNRDFLDPVKHEALIRFEEAYGRAAWKHAVDALGLAMYAMETLALSDRRDQILRGIKGE